MNDLIMLNDSNHKRNHRIFLVLGLLLLILIGSGFLKIYKSSVSKNPIYEKNMEKCDDGSKQLVFCSSGQVDLTDRKLRYEFCNPKNSKKYVKLVFQTQDTNIAKTNTIPPGYKLTELEIGDKSKLQPGLSDGKVIIQSVDPKSGKVTKEESEYLAITVKK